MKQEQVNGALMVVCVDVRYLPVTALRQQIILNVA